MSRRPNTPSPPIDYGKNYPTRYGYSIEWIAVRHWKPCSRMMRYSRTTKSLSPLVMKNKMTRNKGSRLTKSGKQLRHMTKPSPWVSDSSLSEWQSPSGVGYLCFVICIVPPPICKRYSVCKIRTDSTKMGYTTVRSKPMYLTLIQLVPWHCSMNLPISYSRIRIHLEMAQAREGKTLAKKISANCWISSPSLVRIARVKWWNSTPFKYWPYLAISRAKR